MPKDSRLFQSPENGEDPFSVSLPQNLQPGAAAQANQGFQNFRSMTDVSGGSLGRLRLQIPLKPPELLDRKSTRLNSSH